MKEVVKMMVYEAEIAEKNELIRILRRKQEKMSKELYRCQDLCRYFQTYKDLSNNFYDWLKNINEFVNSDTDDDIKVNQLILDIRLQLEHLVNFCEVKK